MRHKTLATLVVSLAFVMCAQNVAWAESSPPARTSYLELGGTVASVAPPRRVEDDPNYHTRFDIEWLDGLGPTDSKLVGRRAVLMGAFDQWRDWGLIDETALPFRIRFRRKQPRSGFAGFVFWGERTAYIWEDKVDSRLLRHELFHLVWLDPNAPQWFTEGVAELFASPYTWYDDWKPGSSNFLGGPAAIWNDSSADPAFYAASTEAAHSLMRAIGRDEFIAQIRLLVHGETTAQNIIELGKDASKS